MAPLKTAYVFCSIILTAKLPHASISLTDSRSQVISTSNGKHADLIMRTTTSNSNVASKGSRDITLLKTKARSAKPVVESITSVMQSDEDDSLDRDVAMSSPVKGKDYQTTVQVCFSYLL